MAEQKKETTKVGGPKPAGPDIGLIYPAILAIMDDIPAIYKERKNDSQNYNFRGIDDVYNAINPLLSKHGVFMKAEVLEKTRVERPARTGGGTLAFVQVYTRYHFVAKDGSFVTTETLGEGMDSGDKATAKAMSIAQKYAILQMFCIPTIDPKEPENDSPEPAAGAEPAKTNGTKPAAQAGAAKPPAEAPKPGAAVAAPTPEALRAKRKAGILAILSLAIPGQTEETILGGIHGEIKRLFNRDFAEPSELTVAENSAAVDYLRRWYLHVKQTRKAAAAKHAKEEPRPDEEDREPGDDAAEDAFAFGSES
jgi:hypothetical protein